MKKSLLFCLAGLACLAGGALAQEEAAIGKALADLQAALARGDLALAKTFLSPAMAARVAAAVPATAGEGEEFLFLDGAAFLQGELSGAPHQNWTPGRVSVAEGRGVSEFRLENGKLVKLDWAKDAEGAWRIVPPTEDVFREEQKQDDAQAQSLRQAEKKMESRQQEDQEIADDVNEDRRR